FALVTIFGPFAYAAFKAIEWRWWLSGIRFGEVRLESTMSRGALIGLYWKVIGWAMLLGTVFLAYLVLCIFLAASIDGSSIETF
ncbi:hypothetical protein ABTO05_21220, partial [Acinetobacter baumannii]